MVYFFTSNVVSPPVTLFMGFDKYENEELIKWGWPEDVWFHVDKVSSAHVYLRLREADVICKLRWARRLEFSAHPTSGQLSRDDSPQWQIHNAQELHLPGLTALQALQGQTIEDIPADVLEDAAQLVKANSITGNKMNDVEVVYTMWSNLKKTDGMEPGQVAFFKEKEVYKIRVAKRINEIVNRLNKTKKEENLDFRAEREARDAKERDDKKRILRELQAKQKEEEKRRKEEAELRSYTTLMKPEMMTSNKDGNDSDDFM